MFQTHISWIDIDVQTGTHTHADPDTHGGLSRLIKGHNHEGGVCFLNSSCDECDCIWELGVLLLVVPKYCNCHWFVSECI